MKKPPYSPAQDGGDDTAEQKRPGNPTGGISTIWSGLGRHSRRYIARQENKDALLDGWREDLKRRIADEKPLIEED